MRHVLAAVDRNSAARAVLEAARRGGQLTGAQAMAVHVRNPDDEPADDLREVARRLAVPLELRDGPVEAALLAALAAPEVVLGVVGARATPGGRRPVGHTALELLQQASRPLLVVPPEAVDGPSHAFQRVLVPLEGDEASSLPLIEALGALITAPVEVIALHVYTSRTAPPVQDHPEWGLELWTDEFLARYCPTASRVALRTGPIGGSITDMADAAAADLVVLCWSQDMSEGHAAVIRDVLANATTPVLLLPVGPPAGGAG